MVSLSILNLWYVSFNYNLATHSYDCPSKFRLRGRALMLLLNDWTLITFSNTQWGERNIKVNFTSTESYEEVNKISVQSVRDTQTH